MLGTKLSRAHENIPSTGNPGLDYLLGALVPVTLGVIYLLVKGLRVFLNNKIKKQELEEQKLTQEIKTNKKGK